MVYYISIKTIKQKPITKQKLCNIQTKIYQQPVWHWSSDNMWILNNLWFQNNSSSFTRILYMIFFSIKIKSDMIHLVFSWCFPHTTVVQLGHIIDNKVLIYNKNSVHKNHKQIHTYVFGDQVGVPNTHRHRN